MKTCFEAVMWTVCFIFVIFTCVTMLSGCASTSDNFDPGFTSEEVSTIEAGFSEWPKHQPVEIVAAPNSATDCPKPDPSILAWTLVGNAEHQTVICLYKQYDGDNLQRIAAHEMGHALAGNNIHTPDDGPPSIMKATIENDALEPTAYDLAQCL